MVLNPMNKWMLWGTHPYFWVDTHICLFELVSTFPVETPGPPLGENSDPINVNAPFFFSSAKAEVEEVTGHGGD